MTPPQSKNNHPFKKKRFTYIQGARLLSATTAMSIAVAGILIAPPANAASDVPDPVPSISTAPTPTGKSADVPGSMLEAPVETALPEPEVSGSVELTEAPTPAPHPAEPSVPPAPTPDPVTEAAEPADTATVEDIPLDEMTEEQKLALLKELQGENGAAMGKGLELREEREAELETVEGQEQLAETLEVLEIDRTAAVSIAASNRDHWRAPGVQGMDVSGWQPEINWKTEWNLGARFAYVKATESTTYKNPEFGSQYTGSYNVGMIRGAYHFAIPTRDLATARDQARYFVANGGGWSGDGKTLPPLLDIEFNPYPQLGNTCYNLSPSQMVNWVLEFSRTMKSLTGRVPAVYTNGSWWNQCTNYSTALKNHPLHVAHFSTGNVTSPWLPAGWNRFDIWQYSESGPFLGDSNVWRGSLTQLKDFAKYPSGVKPAAPKPKPISTSVTTAAPGDLNMDGNGDLVSRRTDGSLWFYPGNGRGGYNNPSRIGGGWQIYNKLIGAGNYNGDKYPDLLARHDDGSLWFYAGTGNGKFKSRVEVGTSGWNQFRSIINAGDVNGDGKRDLIAARPDGVTYLYPGRGNGRTGARVVVGNSWDKFDRLVASGDFTGDGKADVVATQKQGTLWLLEGTGSRPGLNKSFKSARLIGSSGWQSIHQVLGGGDNNRDGKNDLVAVYSDKKLRFYAGTEFSEPEGYKSRVKTGASVWRSHNLVIAPGDFNGDGRDDLISRKPDGTLWFAPGNGRGSYGSLVRIGTGWQTYKQLTAVGDYNRDGKNDLVGAAKDGKLWFYAGTGKVGRGNEGYKRRVKIGSSGWAQFSQLEGAGDINRDGKNDLLAVRPDGKTYLYMGLGTGRSHGPRTEIASGWNAYTEVAPVGDYDGNGTDDVVFRKKDGTLWLRTGLTKRSGSAWLSAERKIGSGGWNGYNRIFGAGDFNRDGKADMLATKSDGSAWFYAGTQFKVAGAVESGVYTDKL